jgi:multidrug efflux system outer membrane protein
VAEVGTAWLVLAPTSSACKLAQDTLASQQRSYELIERSHALGAQSGLALAQAQTTVDSRARDVATFDSQVEQDRNALDLLAGGHAARRRCCRRHIGTPMDTAGARRATAGAARRLAVVSVLQQRPDVLAAEHALRASNADIGAARAAFYPRISLTGSAGTASSSLSGLFKGGSAPGTSRRRSACRSSTAAPTAPTCVAEAQQQIQLASYEKTLQTAFREVADALAARRTLGERLAAQQSLVAATRAASTLSQALFRSGGGAYLDVLTRSARSTRRSRR